MYKLDATGKCVYQGASYVQTCPYGCQNCTFNTKLSVMDCLLCKNNFVGQLSSTTGAMECQLQCPKNCLRCFVNTKNVTTCDLCEDGFSLAKDVCIAQ